MGAVVGVVLSWPMTGYKSGAATRRAILLALLEDEPRTVRGLAADIGLRHQVVDHHIGVMERAGMVSVERRRGRLGSMIRLTEAGRTAARTI